MAFMAAACGILIIVLGFLSTIINNGKAPSEAQFAIQVTCLVGGLILCFVAIVLARLAKLTRKLDEFEAAAEQEE